MLSEIRTKNGMSQKELAEKSGVKLRMIQCYEQGYRDINGASMSALVDLALILNCSLSDLVTDDGLKDKLHRLGV